MDGISRLKLPKALFLFSSNTMFSKKNSPKLHVGILLRISSVPVCLFPILLCNSTGESFIQSGIVLSSCRFRLSNTLSELWVSNSHTRWH